MPPRFNIPPVTRAMLITLGLQSLLSAAVRYGRWSSTDSNDAGAVTDILVPYLTLVPSLSLFYPWVWATTSLVESNVFTLAITGVTLYHGGRYLERAWSSAAFFKFIAIVTLLPNLLTALLYLALYALTGNAAWLLTTIAGGVALQMSFLVAFSQLAPAHTVTLFKGLVSMRVPRFPLMYLGLVVVLVCTVLSISALFLALLGLLTSWTYLRFYKLAYPDLDTAQGPSLRGDASETFAFAEFFPDVVRPAVAAVGDQLFHLLVAVKLCTPFSAADISAARGDAYLAPRGAGSGGGGMGGSTRAETERRRALALKALDQRLSAATASSSTAPSHPSAPAPAPVPVQTTQQPVNAAATMSSSPTGGSILGETSYTPEHDEPTGGA